MKARHLLEQSSYGPTKLHDIFQAFDQAWAEIAGNFGDDAVDVESGRMRWRMPSSLSLRRTRMQRASRALLCSRWH